MELLNQILTMVQGLSASSWIGAAIVVLEALMRFTPTQKPMGFLYLISDGVKVVGNILNAAGQLLDKILPQRIK